MHIVVEPCWLCPFAARETGRRRLVVGTGVEEIGGVTSRHPTITDPAIAGWVSPLEIIWWPSLPL